MKATALIVVTLVAVSSLAVGCKSTDDEPVTGNDDLTSSTSPNAKIIACTGPAVDAKLTLDRTDKRGSLTITRKPSADRHDPPNVTVTMDKVAGSQVPGWVYFETPDDGVTTEVYLNMHEDDFARGSGSVAATLQWAENGEQFDVGATCAFTR